MSDSAPRDPTPSDPLHGVTLEEMLIRLEEAHGWPELGRRVQIRCFLENPSVASSLKFLRKTPWARAKVERLYLELVGAPLPPLPPRRSGPPRAGRR